ncbi:unnamed protein product [Closterium sp. Yama58-4]|nr:unnamed protein product [Closterium sp. Yama58-4]
MLRESIIAVNGELRLVEIEIKKGQSELEVLRSALASAEYRREAAEQRELMLQNEVERLRSLRQAELEIIQQQFHFRKLYEEAEDRLKKQQEEYDLKMEELKGVLSTVDDRASQAKTVAENRVRRSLLITYVADESELATLRNQLHDEEARRKSLEKSLSMAEYKCSLAENQLQEQMKEFRQKMEEQIREAVPNRHADAIKQRMMKMRKENDELPSAAAEGPADLAAVPSSALVVSLSPGATTRDIQQTLAMPYSGPVAQIAEMAAAVAPSPDSAFPVSQSAADSMAAASPVIDGAQLLGGGKREVMIRQLENLEREYGWRMRVLTRYAPEQFETDALRAVWQPDDRTVVVVADVTSPNILNFFAGDTVREKLPRQFFIELQSRFGNQFYVAEQGDTRAVQEAVATLQTCLLKPTGCSNVPGLVDDLYFVTLSTAILSGIVFGFAARLEPSGKVEASWQWVLLFSPLWLLLLVAFSYLPITARTDDVEPLLKNGAGFLAGAAAIYLTPIFGQSPVANWGKGKEDGTRSGTQSGRDSDSDGF